MKHDSRQPTFDFENSSTDGDVQLSAQSQPAPDKDWVIPIPGIGAQAVDERQTEAAAFVSASQVGSEPTYSHSTWREVPAARFLSWSPAMQYAYCAARDRDSAEHAENDEWRQFYLRRAGSST